MSEESIFLAYP